MIRCKVCGGRALRMAVGIAALVGRVEGTAGAAVTEDSMLIQEWLEQCG